MDIDRAEAIVRTDVGSEVTKMTSKEIKRDLMVFARNNPSLFLELANDENLNIPDNESSNEVVIDNLPTGQQSSQGAKPSDDGFPLRAGKYGYKVYLLQSALNKLGASLRLDGKFGQATYDAITDYGDLPFYDWNFTCNFQYIELCVITKQKWDKILSNAKKQGWNEQQAKEDASKNWLEFSGSKQKFSNIEI